MARPAKSITMKTGLMTKDEINKRLEYEMKLKGESDNIRPPSFLTKKQRVFFEGIVNYLETSGILSNLDVYILAQTAITIDRIQTCETHINENGVVDLDGNPNPHIKIKNSYMKEFFRLCNELSLSPQSRAKLANMNYVAEAEKTDPLLSILGGDG
ncbi:phage terminase small subunit P27 family [Lachnospiraceae bacterium NSJ-12]|uniref:Phage terminase small subunit P27 family n=2 Tax=Zhenhengia yiwuensis TaxID=2763666 RepID=A0A926EH33_9FIRM|nr:phage terminase small subunit P27 family [Zhenhengia yiwuensis]